MHFRVALPVGVLRRTWRMDDHGIHDSPGTQAQTLALQIGIDRFQHQGSQSVRLQYAAEVEDRGLVGDAIQHGWVPNASLRGFQLAKSSLITTLRYIEGLYAHADMMFASSSLNDALGSVDDALLSKFSNPGFYQSRTSLSWGHPAKRDGELGFTL